MRGRRIVMLAGATTIAAGLVMAPMAEQSAGARPFNYNSLSKIQKRLLSGALSYQLEPVKEQSTGITPNIIPGGNDDDGGGADGLPNTPPNGYAAAGARNTGSNYLPSKAGGCVVNYGSNVKVNQNCLNVADPTLQGRSQANNETSIAADPNNSSHLVASDNDYRRGDGTCGAAYSLDAGSTWSDATVPNGFTAGDTAPRQYWQAGGDTSVAWDTRGNSYLACQLFNRGAATSQNPDQSSAFVIYRSTGNSGASFDFPGRYAKVFYDHPGTAGVLEDKELLTVDSNPKSPYRDRVYVTYTEFAADGSAYIYETLLQQLRRDLQQSRAGQFRQRAMHEHLRRRNAERQLQREPVLRPVRRAGRVALRCLRQFQQPGHRQRQPQPDADRQVDQRRRQLRPAGQGQ